MWQASGRTVENQAIIRVGLKEFLPQVPGVRPVSTPMGFHVSEFRALVDTGAQISSLTRRAVNQMGLVSFGKEWIKGSGGDHLHKRYYFYLGFFCRDLRQTQSAMPETYYQLGDLISAVDIDDNANFDVIVGMNVLKNCDMAFTRNGDFTVTIP